MWSATERLPGDVDLCAMLEVGLDRLRADAGRDGGRIGLSIVKKLDFRPRGDGDGGICDNVSMVRSESEGLGRRWSEISLDFGCCELP